MSYLATKSLKVDLPALPSVRNQLQSEENHRVPFLTHFQRKGEPQSSFTVFFLVNVNKTSPGCNLSKG